MRKYTYCSAFIFFGTALPTPASLTEPIALPKSIYATGNQMVKMYLRQHSLWLPRPIYMPGQHYLTQKLDRRTCQTWMDVASPAFLYISFEFENGKPSLERRPHHLDTCNQAGQCSTFSNLAYIHHRHANLCNEIPLDPHWCLSSLSSCSKKCHLSKPRVLVNFTNQTKHATPHAHLQQWRLLNYILDER